ALRDDGFVASGEADGLEWQAADLLWIIEGELDNASYLFVIDSVDDGDDGNDFDAGTVEVIYSFKLYIEQVADFAVGVGGVADAIELQIRVAHSGVGGLLGELKALGEFNAIGCGLYGVIADFSGIANGV